MSYNATTRLLRQYYGLAPVDKEKEARDIDSKEFQPQVFFQESLAKDSLQQLLARENSLISDIRTFENDLQTLVYNNYTKFLGASDIVRSLSTNISSLTTQMNCLQAGLANVAKHTDEITNDLDANRQKIQRLSGISRLLDRIQYISQLPNKLRLCLQYGQYKTAVHVWNKVETILLNQRRYKSFEAIHGECSEIMKEIKAKIHGQMLNTDISVTDSVEYATLLIDLHNPVTIVCSQLAHHRFLVIDNALEECQTKGGLPSDPFLALRMIKAVAIDDSKKFINLYCELFKSDLSKVEGILNDFQENIFSRISELLPLKSLFTLDCKSFAQYLNEFTTLMSSITIQQQISRYIHDALQGYTKARVSIIYQKISAIANPEVSEPNQELNFSKEAISIFNETTVHLINDFQDLVNQGFHECAAFLTDQLSLSLSHLFVLFKNVTPEATLGAALTAQALANQEIANLFGDLSRLSNELPLQGLQEKLSSDANEVSLETLELFIAYKRAKIDDIIQSSIFNFSTENSDHKIPSEWVTIFLKEIMQLDNDLHEILFSQSQKHDYHSTFGFESTAPTFFGLRDTGNFHQIVERMFTSVNMLHLGTTPKFEAQSILTAVVMYSLKTVLELCRQMIFDNDQFNQFQFDGYCLYKQLCEKLDKQDIFAALDEEIVSSVADRTIEPVPLSIETLKVNYDNWNSKNINKE